MILDLCHIELYVRDINGYTSTLADKTGSGGVAIQVRLVANVGFYPCGLVHPVSQT